MRIKNVSCTQFAGVRDSNVTFTDGINVVYGKNESGKSTLVNLMARTLFQNAMLDRRKDKEFFESYFPGMKKDSAVKGDFADGKLSFETENGIFTLTKEWGDDSRCTLSTPDGVVRDQGTIDKILKDALVYGEGVYSDMLFSSQKNTDISLQTILDASKKTDAKQEITDAVSQAFAESDGVSVDVVEQAINAKIDEIAGKHWDFERGIPVRKTGATRWANGLGEILKAYYVLEDAKAVLEEISRLEQEADRTATEYAEKDTEVNITEKKYNKFNTIASRLTLQSERKKTIIRIEKELQKVKDALDKWPGFNESLEKAIVLQAELTAREVLDKYEAAKKIVAEIKEVSSVDINVEIPSGAEIKQVKAAETHIATLKNSLCGMNLNAAINMLGDNEVEIISLRTGESIEIKDGLVPITEAVKLIVPGVMEMQLSPADVDVAAVEAKIAEMENTISDILAKYNVVSADELEELARNIAEAKTKSSAAESRLEMLLGGEKFEELEAAAKLITSDCRPKRDIYDEISSVCGNSDVTGFITKIETLIGGYIAEYGTINDLKAKAFDLDTEMQKAKESVSSAGNLPEEFAGIADPEAHLELLQSNLKAKQIQRESALTAKTAASSKLESYKSNISGDPAEDAERAELKFEEQKSLLDHWLHISEVFKAQKENINDNPMQDIADSFTKYLGVISGGKVSSEFPDADKLNMNIYSDNRLLDYGKLSEGTKETVSLAFRLAVLDHLFPEGGGVIVFDDPFTDMDVDRTAQSCELIKECGEKHQVIFLTCKEEYLEMLQGNQIRLEG